MYSRVIVTNIPEKINVKKSECREDSVFYIIKNITQLSLLVPQELNQISEMQVYPNCTYKIQVHAYPRAKPEGKLSEVTKYKLSKLSVINKRRSTSHSSMSYL